MKNEPSYGPAVVAHYAERDSGLALSSQQVMEVDSELNNLRAQNVIWKIHLQAIARAVGGEILPGCSDEIYSHVASEVELTIKSLRKEITKLVENNANLVLASDAEFDRYMVQKTRAEELEAKCAEMKKALMKAEDWLCTISLNHMAKGEEGKAQEYEDKGAFCRTAYGGWGDGHSKTC